MKKLRPLRHGMQLVLVGVLALLFSTSVYAQRVPKTTAPQYGGTLKICVLRDALSLGNPPDLRGYMDYLMSRPCVETLGRYDKTGKMVPWLAKGWKEDPKAKTITLVLRQDVKFHDGTDCSAEAVKWNLDQFRTSGRDELKRVESVDIVDTHTIRLTLTEWDNTVLSAVGYFAGPIISPTAFKTKGKDWCKNNPVGTGPFQFVGWNHDVSVTYKKFNDYWQKGKPYLDGIEFQIVKDVVTAASAFRKHEMDMFVDVPGQYAKEFNSQGIQVTTLNTGMGTTLVGLVGSSARSDSPFAKVKVRQALSYAIDTKTIAETILTGGGIATNQWGVPTGWSYNPKVKGYPYNPGKAKELLKQAGYLNGFKTKLYCISDPENQQLMTAVQGYLAKVGIDGELEPLTWAKRDQISVSGWDGLQPWTSRPDPDLAWTMPRTLSSSGVVYTKSIIHPEKIEKTLVDVRKANSFKEKKALAYELQRLVFDEYAVFTPFYVKVLFGAKYPAVHTDGFYTIEGSQWTPEDAWMERR
jgi:peptide/nickel transport system substrate-binding protein